MAEIVQGLFGVTPESLNAQREQAAQAQALQYAQLDPNQQAQMGFYQAGSRLGTGLAGLMGAQDPEMQRITQRQQMLKGVNPNDPESLKQGIQAAMQGGDYQLASTLNAQYQAAAKAAQGTQQAQAELRKTTAEAGGIEYKAAQDVKLRDELSKLGANPTQEQIVSVVAQYGSPDKVLAVVQGASDKEAARAQALEVAKTAAEAKVEAAKEAGATKLEVARIQAESRTQMAQLTAALKQSTAQSKPLSPSLQKSEDTDLAAIDTYAAQRDALAPAIKSITANTAGTTKLVLGPIQNRRYEAQNLSGASTPESRAYADLKSSVDTAVNLQVSAEKGVQTDKDVLRFANALVAAYGGNDTQATLAALEKYNNAIQTAENKTKVRIDSRRKSQKVEPYFQTAEAAPVTTPPKAPVATKRWNPQTQKLEVL